MTTSTPTLHNYKIGLRMPHLPDTRVTTHGATSRAQAERMAKEDFCSDTGFPWEQIDSLVVTMSLKLAGPTRNMILDEFRGSYIRIGSE